MRLFLSAVVLSLCVTPVLAAGTEPVDLVARFIVGADDGATLSMDGITVGTLTRSGPGNFSATPTSGAAFGFAVTERGKCVFEIGFTQGGVAGGSIELDATRLQAVSYETLKENAEWTDYRITLHGQPGVLQQVGASGQLSPIGPSSQLSTSLAADMMQAAVTELQKTTCPAAAR